ncbi:hypothetical protein SUDANB58_02515 [Streptomyces sp. enrichment culture]|uniref:DUF397 domain-containing protein n=1 Tax=Streptomyces sp. enrichment culture TaxID=1795815 RepID=UPI003F544926
MTSALEWFKSSYSSNDGPDCVEVAISPAARPIVHVRDSKDRDGARLTFTDATWNRFLAFTTRG